MKTLKRLSPPVKMVIIVIYTMALLALSIFIISCSNIDETKGYAKNAIDENIQIATKLVETRTSDYVKDTTKKEKASWKLYFQVLQHNINVNVTDIQLHGKVKAENGQMIYFEESQLSNTSYKGLPNTTQTSFYTYPKYTYSETQIEKTNVYSSSSKEYVKTNTEAKMVYVTVSYKVSEKETPDDKTTKEFKYYFVPIKPGNEDFSKYETLLEMSNFNKTDITPENDYYKMNIKPAFSTVMTTPEETFSDSIAFEITGNIEKLKEQQKYVVDSQICVFAKVKNDGSDFDNYFVDYITIVDINGVLIDGSNKDSWKDTTITNIQKFYNADSSINSTYQVSEVYVYASYTLNTGETIYNRVKVVLPQR